MVGAVGHAGRPAPRALGRRWLPRGLRGEEIALAARIVAVADVFDVMTGLRSYRGPVSAALARRELAACAGKQFDPAVVRAMLSVSLGQMWPAMGPAYLAGPAPLAEGHRAGGRAGNDYHRGRGPWW